MSLYQRQDSPYWWIKLAGPHGGLQRSSGTTDRQKAQELHDKLKAAQWDQVNLGKRPAQTWNDAVVRYIQETTHKVSQHDDQLHLRWLDAHLSGLPLSAITRDVIDALIAKRVHDGVRPATVNRMLEVVRALLRKAAHEWDWVAKVPHVKLLKITTRRIRWLTHAQADTLIATLPPHLADMVAFSVQTGLRQANVTGLQWSAVDLARRCAWVHPDQAKARKAIAVPLSVEAVRVLQRQIGKHAQFVFTYRGHPVTQVNTKAWKAGLQRAGIADFRWHDLRHTWASWHVQAGTPLHVLQQLGGWASIDMVLRYAHLAGDHLAPYVDRIAPPRAHEAVREPPA